ncbi:hypothetical protein F5Y15DRAFT_430611 [Xylariaceae sp. FL0016]|nr:hypothetical protein F5Y15DRAFT_430611 [Xylariaceae sp. FL0016]
MVRIAVIGAGPAGLVTLKYLLTAQETLETAEPVQVRLFEADTDIGGTFRARTYEDGELVSSRQLTTFSDLRYNNGQDFFTVEHYLEYLEEYCRLFKLRPHILFSSLVTKLERRNSGGHVLTYVRNEQEHTWDCDAVAICSGLHVDATVPRVVGIERVPVILHSSQFKQREQFGVDKTVMILGSGETASDLSYLAVTSPTKRVVLCHRNGFHLAPNRNPNPRLILSRHRSLTDKPQVPIDVSRASLFDTAYVHPWLRSSMLLWAYYDYYVRWILWISWGTTHGTNQWIGEKPAGWSTSQIFFNKSGHKIAPYISAPYKPTRPHGLLAYLRSFVVREPVTDTRGRTIDVAPWPERIDERGVVHFRDNGRPEYARMRDGQEVRPDVVVFCTGYLQDFPFLSASEARPSLTTASSSSSSPSTTTSTLTASLDPATGARTRTGGTRPGGERRRLVRDIWPPGDPSVAYIGFVRPNLGAIPPLAELQAQLWVLRLLAPARLRRRGRERGGRLLLRAADEAHYRLVVSRGDDDDDDDGGDARVRYGVDHESYAYQLALDMGAAPGFLEMVRLGLAARRAVVVGEGGDGDDDDDDDDDDDGEKMGLVDGVEGRARRDEAVKGVWYKLLLTWALGANFNTKFRLVGPWAWDGAVTVMADELWDTVARREVFFGHITLSLAPMLVFGPLSLIVFVVATMLEALTWLWSCVRGADRTSQAEDELE